MAGSVNLTSLLGLTMSENKHNLPSTNRNQGSVELHDNGLRAGNLIDQALSRLDPDQVRALGVKAGEEALKLQARQAQQNIDYVTGKKVVEDHIQTWEALNKSGKTTRQSVTTDVETGAGKMRIESKSGATCFVATAAYGDLGHPDVEFLRWYRDTVLSSSRIGRAFTRLYWKVGPHLAALVQPSAFLRKTVRAGLGKLVAYLKYRHPKV